MNIIFPEIHTNLSKRISIAFNALGHTMIVPSDQYKPTYYGPTRPDWIWNSSYNQQKADKIFKYKNVRVLSKEEILDSKIDCVFISSFENQFEIIHELMPKMPKSTKLCHFSGNDYKSPYDYGYF